MKLMSRHLLESEDNIIGGDENDRESKYRI